MLCGGKGRRRKKKEEKESRALFAASFPPLFPDPLFFPLLRVYTTYCTVQRRVEST